MDTKEDAKSRLAIEHKQMADRLEGCIPLLQKFIRCMRGEEQDLTGLGLWRIFCDNLEHTMKCRVITEDQWQGFLELQKKAYERR